MKSRVSPVDTAMSILGLRCRCGEVTGSVERPDQQSGRRLVCYCDDCQAAAHFFDRPEALLDRDGGTEVYQTAPARLTLEAGEHLRCMRQSPKGLLRWYAGCCRSRSSS